VLGITEGVERHSLGAEKIRFAVETQHMFSAMDSLNLCQFVFGPTVQLYGPNDMVELVRTVTGWDDVTFQELQEVGERRLNMMRAFNAREGLDRKNDLIPEKLFKPMKGGASDGWVLDRDEMEGAMDKYFELCGWDVKTGNPTRNKLEELDLGWVADQLA
ncbi:MAG: aldehyde ferredoxin oxidoreductase C-terminal domain-containing protein, partial [Chloroflexota bacterium]